MALKRISYVRSFDIIKLCETLAGWWDSALSGNVCRYILKASSRRVYRVQFSGIPPLKVNAAICQVPVPGLVSQCDFIQLDNPIPDETRTYRYHLFI